jgi:hypothetical protein
MGETDLGSRRVLLNVSSIVQYMTILCVDYQARLNFRIPNLRMEQKLSRDIKSQVHENAHTRLKGPTEFRGAYCGVRLMPQVQLL